MKPWIDIDEVGAFDSNLGKELQELYVAYDQKLRTFRESREAMHQKGKNRVFYQNGKGNPKGKSKGQSKGKKGSVNTVLTVQSVQGFSGKGKGSPSSPSKQPGYTGCFICGDKSHDYRACPKRGNQAASSSTSPKSKPIRMVQSVEPDVASSSTGRRGTRMRRSRQISSG